MVIDTLLFRAAFPILGMLLVAYFWLGQRGVPVSLITGVAALTLLALAGRWHRFGRGALIAVSAQLRAAPWQIVLFSLGMYLVVYGLRNAGLTQSMAQGLEWLERQGPVSAIIGAGFGAAILSSVMNNLPATLTGALAISQAHFVADSTGIAMTYANVIGCDLGPKFTPIGSLATLLWMHVLQSKGLHVGWWPYMKFGLRVTPPVLLATLVALGGWLALTGL